MEGFSSLVYLGHCQCFLLFVDPSIAVRALVKVAYLDADGSEFLGRICKKRVDRLVPCALHRCRGLTILFDVGWEIALVSVGTSGRSPFAQVFSFFFVCVDAYSWCLIHVDLFCPSDSSLWAYADPHPFHCRDTVGPVVGLVPQFVFPSVGFLNGVGRAWLILGKRA